MKFGSKRRHNQLQPLPLNTTTVSEQQEQIHMSASTEHHLPGSANLQLHTERHTQITLAGNPKRPPEVGMNRMSAAGNNNPQMDYGHIKFFDYNFHAVKKGVQSALLDVSLLMANASQLKSVIVSGPDAQFYHVMLVLLIASISLQVIVGCILIWLSRININDADDGKQDQAELLNNVVVIGIFLLTMLNVFIASIGISKPN